MKPPSVEHSIPLIADQSKLVARSRPLPTPMYLVWPLLVVWIPIHLSSGMIISTSKELEEMPCNIVSDWHVVASTRDVAGTVVQRHGPKGGQRRLPRMLRPLPSFQISPDIAA